MKYTNRESRSEIEVIAPLPVNSVAFLFPFSVPFYQSKGGGTSRRPRMISSYSGPSRDSSRSGEPQGLFSKNGTVPLEDRFHRKKDLLSVLKQNGTVVSKQALRGGGCLAQRRIVRYISCNDDSESDQSWHLK